MVLAIIQSYPLISLLVSTFVITFGLTLVYKFFSDQKEIKSSKDKIKELQERMKAEKDAEKVMVLQKEMLEVNMIHLRHSMKPLLITFIPLLLVFWWLKVTFLPFGVFIPWSISTPGFCWMLPGFCDGAGWFLIYIFFSFFCSMGLRKVLGVH